MKFIERWKIIGIVKLVVLFFCSLEACPARTHEASFKQYAISSNANIQSKIDHILEVCSSGAISDEIKKQEIENFLSSKEYDRRVLLLQVLLSYGGDVDYQENPQHEMLKRMLIFRLTEGIDEQDLVAFIVPYYENESDLQMQQNLRIPLNEILFRNGHHQPDFEKLESFLGANKESPPTNLIVNIMMQSNPKSALITLAKVYSDTADMEAFLQATAPMIETSAIAARRLSPDSVEMRNIAKSRLTELSSSTQWWVRLYVATVMHKEPYLRMPEVIKILEQDDNSLVRDIVSRLKEKP